MKIGIIGLPQSGKTTIFNAAAGKAETVGDYSRAAHRAVIRVPDRRLDRLGELAGPKKMTPAEIDYLDLVAFTGKGRETDAAALVIPEDLRYTDALLVVVRCFAPDIAPEKSFSLFLEELILTDQIIIERNLEKKERTARLAADKAAMREVETLQKCLATVESGRPLADGAFDDNDHKILAGYRFLSLKPLLIVLNIAEEELGREDQWLNRFRNVVAPGLRDCIAICGKIEMELAALDDNDRRTFLADLGIRQPAMDTLIQKSYALLGLVSFFTIAGPEIRAWTVRAGTNARNAAGAVHSDMERGFIRAEVVAFDDLDRLGSLAAARESGLYRLEGKDYLVRDGDVILFRFNV